MTIFLPGDKRSKQPTNTERMLFELAKQMEMANRMLGLIQKQILALARLQNITPADLAVAFRDEVANQVYFKNVGTQEQILMKREEDENKQKDEQLKKMLPADINDAKIINQGDKKMPIDPNFDVDLKALCDKYQVHVVGKVTPVNPDEESFDIAASPAGATPPAPAA